MLNWFGNCRKTIKEFKAYAHAVSVRQTLKNTVEEFKGLFPTDPQILRSFELTDDFCVIKPRQFLGSEKFGKIAEMDRGKGGEYISSGKDSHFRIPLNRREN